MEPEVVTMVRDAAKGKIIKRFFVQVFKNISYS